MRAALLLLGLACVGHNRHVFVPNTEPARTCRAGCIAKAKQCDPGDMPSVESYGDTASLAQAQRMRDECEDHRLDCLLTCPGARED